MSDVAAAARSAELLALLLLRVSARSVSFTEGDTVMPPWDCPEVWLSNSS